MYRIYIDYNILFLSRSSVEQSGSSTYNPCNLNESHIAMVMTPPKTDIGNALSLSQPPQEHVS